MRRSLTKYTSSVTTDIRARARDVLRAELAEAIVQIFVERGFENVTVDEAAGSVGISRATFFRYFAGKEDAVVAAVELEDPQFEAALEVPGDADTLWKLARLALEPTVRDAQMDSVHRRERLRMIGSQPALRARLSQRRHRLVEELAGALSRFAHDPADVTVVAAAAMTALDVAWHRWALDDDAHLSLAVDAAFASLARAGESIAG
jgi:AcrR family transcriptional regulator